jgi:MFS transporter, DHA1 family, tetracycline resistance protein
MENEKVLSDEMTEMNMAGAAVKPKRMSRQTLLVLVMTAFLSSMGMTIVFPVLPFIVGKYDNNPDNLASVVGWLSSIYAIGQFIAAPGLGVLSDHFGRRPILLICLAGSALGYVFFGIGGSLWVLFLGRIIDGLTGGDISILSAYVADVSEPEERGKLFGLFGAAMGMGFIVGPVIGGWTAKISYEAPFFLSAGLTGLIMLMALIYMPESLNKSQRSTSIRLSELNPLKQLRDLLKLSGLPLLLLVGVLYRLPFVFLGVNFAVLTLDSLQADPGSIGSLFLIIGVIDIVVQGVLIGKLLPIFGERTLMVVGFVMQTVAYGLMASIVFVASPVLLVVGVIFYAVSSGLIEPSLSSMISRAISPEKQGVVQGSNQALTSLIEITVPIAGGLLYTQIGHASPYILGSIIMVLAAGLVLVSIPKLSRRE